MPTKLSAAREKETYIVKYEPFDHNNKATIPTTVTWTLMKLDESIVNSREDVALVTPMAYENYIVLTGNDLALDEDGVRCRRILLIKATYSGLVGTQTKHNLPIYIESRFDIEPVPGV